MEAPNHGFLRDRHVDFDGTGGFVEAVHFHLPRDSDDLALDVARPGGIHEVHANADADGGLAVEIRPRSCGAHESSREVNARLASSRMPRVWK